MAKPIGPLCNLNCEYCDRYRRDNQGNGTFDRVMQGLRLLQKHKVEYNVLASVACNTSKRPLDAYRFLRDQGVEFIQFTPIVERVADTRCGRLGLCLAGPATLNKEESQNEITSWTVIPEECGDFLIAIYEEWVRHDVGKVFVMNFEWALNSRLGNPSPVCIHAEQCGRSIIIEHNGDDYVCDRCVYPEYRLGNILKDEFPEMIAGSTQFDLSITKKTFLPKSCTECSVFAACRGGCPKHRFTRTYSNELGLHYLCPGYKKFFSISEST